MDTCGFGRYILEKITLGSGSPRRLEILKRLGLNIIVKPPSTDETLDMRLSPEENALNLSLEKLHDVRQNNPEDKWIITADTFITYKDKILGKPLDREDAFSMLSMLSGSEHKVLTGVSVYSKDLNREISEVDSTIVKFKKLTSDEINRYLDLNEWQDAAGAYKIQEMGEILVEYIKGSFSSVMGLPIRRIYGMLISLNFIIPVI